MHSNSVTGHKYSFQIAFSSEKYVFANGYVVFAKNTRSLKLIFSGFIETKLV